MRFVETLLVVFAAIYLMQLLIAALVLATLLLFLLCLWKRPGEALMLGLGLLLLAFISRPIGMAVAAAIAAGFLCCAAIGRLKRRRAQAKCCKPAALPKM